MELNNGLSILPWYDSLEKQSHKKWYAYGQSWPLLCPQGTLLPFQFISRTSISISSTIYAINTETGESSDLGVKPDVTQVSAHDGSYCIVKLNEITVPKLPVGKYTLRVNTSEGTLYSEELTIIDNAIDCIKVEYWNQDTLRFTSGEINFEDDFRFVLYINSTIGKPEYEFEEELTKRLGYKFIESQVSNKIYKFSFVAPEYICDAMRLIRMCDYIKVSTKYDSYNALSFAYEPKWQEQGDLAVVDVEFETDCIIQKLESFNRRLKESFYNALLADIDEPILFSPDTVAQYYTEFKTTSFINGKLIRELTSISPTNIKENAADLVFPVDSLSDESQEAKKMHLADLVNLIGGTEVSKLFKGHYDENGNLKWIEAKAHMGIAGGLTSFIDNGSFKLPSIYDGLPIDNQTIYWDEVKEEVGTDEEGNPVYKIVKVLKAADSVHWNNIEGKPDFSQYATKDSLSGYLPLSGGTMTGQINMPVGIGSAIKFGAESRLFAYNGNFYISAESNLVLASGASGNTVPNNAVIDKTGRMFIANNLAVGYAGFIMDSYKLNVAGDAYVDGKLVVNGTIYPSISSLHNIGGSSKRFACVYADSVDVGGVKISLLQDGVLLIDGNLAVTGGITSYVDGGDLDLPSIYDGLPIDGNTLYWVLDENGKKVMLKSKSGDEEGGGSVKSLLRWSGFREGSWDGSEEKTIEIPSKLSELENDGKFFADGGWIGSDANSVTFGSYLYGDYAANTPKNVGQLLAFNNGDTDSWNRGSQIFIDGENFYYRQYWDNYWRNWRKVISGDSNGVIDYDLTLGGSLNMPSGLAKIKSGEKSIIESYNEGGDTYIIGENHLYLKTKALFTIKEGKGYGILHEGNYKDYEYSAKNLNVVDIRNTAPKPSDLEPYAVTAQFANTDNPGDGWYSGLSIQGWTNDYKAWQLRSGAWGFASDHLYFRNGVLETWNDWRRVITGDVDGVLDSNLEIKGEEGGNIKFVYNSDSAITTNKPNDLASIRQALRFPWYSEAYEIGTIRGNGAHSDGFGITHQNNHLVWKVNREQMDVNGDIRLKGGLIQYNEEGGYFYLEGNLVVSGGISSYVDVGNLNLPSIYDGLPIDNQTIYWEESDGVRVLKAKGGGTGGEVGEDAVKEIIESYGFATSAELPKFNTSDFSVSGGIVSLKGASVKIVSSSDSMSETDVLYVIV